MSAHQDAAARARAARDARTQAVIDRFYRQHGPCCAGCDHWRWANSVAGECTRTAPVSGPARVSMLGMASPSVPIGAGHIMTPRDHVCGEFQDTYDWEKDRP